MLVYGNVVPFLLVLPSMLTSAIVMTYWADAIIDGYQYIPIATTNRRQHGVEESAFSSGTQQAADPNEIGMTNQPERVSSGPRTSIKQLNGKQGTGSASASLRVCLVSISKGAD
jgi:hypothetical protein